MTADLYRLAMAVLQPGYAGTSVPDWMRKALGQGLGGVVLFARNAPSAQVVQQIRAENPAAVVAVDEEGGVVTRFEVSSGSSFPGNRALGVVDDVALTERVARQIGRMLARADVTLDYAPAADVNANPANPVIGVRSFGPDRRPGGPPHRGLRQRHPGRRRRRLRQALPRPRRHGHRLPPGVAHRARLPRHALRPRPAAVPGRHRGRGALGHVRPPPRPRPGSRLARDAQPYHPDRAPQGRARLRRDARHGRHRDAGGGRQVHPRRDHRPRARRRRRRRLRRPDHRTEPVRDPRRHRGRRALRQPVRGAAGGSGRPGARPGELVRRAGGPARRRHRAPTPTTPTRTSAWTPPAPR